MIETMKVRLTGIAPLLMHDNKAANPLNPYAKAMKALTGKRKKTDDDLAEIARIEWEAGLYVSGGAVCIPQRVIDACLHAGAKKSKNGKQYQSGVVVATENAELKYKGNKIKANGSKEIPNPDLDKFFDSYLNMDMVRVSGNQVPRARPIFHDWSFECDLEFDTNVLDRRTLLQIAADAGRLCGLCERRPKLGRFEVEEVK